MMTRTRTRIPCSEEPPEDPRWYVYAGVTLLLLFGLGLGTLLYYLWLRGGGAVL